MDKSVGWEGKETWEIVGVQHGNWSVWGNWSECSTKAWAGVRNRTRTCSNPVPRRGGKPCVGESVQYKPCSLGIQGEDILFMEISNAQLFPSSLSSSWREFVAAQKRYHIAEKGGPIRYQACGLCCRTFDDLLPVARFLVLKQDFFNCRVNNQMRDSGLVGLGAETSLQKVEG